MGKKKLIKRLWEIRRTGEFVDFDEQKLYSKKELKSLSN